MLESDIARFVSPAHIGRVLREREAEHRARLLKAEKAQRQDKAEANEKRIHALISGKDHGTRDAHSFSYAGQARRTSSGESGQIWKDKKEDGWQ